MLRRQALCSAHKGSQRLCVAAATRRVLSLFGAAPRNLRGADGLAANPVAKVNAYAYKTGRNSGTRNDRAYKGIRKLS